MGRVGDRRRGAIACRPISGAVDGESLLCLQLLESPLGTEILSKVVYERIRRSYDYAANFSIPSLKTTPSMTFLMS